MTTTLPRSELEALEAQVQTALRTAGDDALPVLGYGEVTLVLRRETGGGSFACKRLPVFPDRGRFERYRHCLAEYLERLEKGGIRVAETELLHTELERGRIAAYCVQPALPADRLLPELLGCRGPVWAEELFARFLDHVCRAVTPALGLDAQASNWAGIDGELVYLDVTTPLMRDRRGRERLDVRLFFSSLPWLLRDAVRISQAGAIFDAFYSPRGAVLDFLGNLYKERLDALIPGFLRQANARLDTPLTEHEVAAYYRRDARMWQRIQRLRRADRRWHRAVRRPYPFLLPPDAGR